MKYTILILLTLISFCISSRTKCEQEDTCAVCQITIYKLKFKHLSGCSVSRCRNTCYKVEKEWTQPNSQFLAFEKDTVGKCDACFRAGYCRATQCENQKRKEQRIIENVINSKDLMKTTGDSSHMKQMVSDVIDDKNVEFSKLAKRVRKQTKEVLKNKNFQKKNKEMAKSLKEVLEYNDK